MTSLINKVKTFFSGSKIAKDVLYWSLAVILVIVAVVYVYPYSKEKISGVSSYSIKGALVRLDIDKTKKQLVISFIPENSKEIKKGFIDSKTLIYMITNKDGKIVTKPISTNILMPGDKIGIESKDNILKESEIVIARLNLIK
jgi:hypothetical protein